MEQAVAQYRAWLEAQCQTPLALLAVVSFLLASYALGDLILVRLCGLRMRHPAFATLSVAVLGLNLSALLAFLLGVLGLCVPQVVLPVSLLGSLRSLFLLFKARSSLAGVFKDSRHLWLLGIGAPLFILCLGGALCLPTGAHLDEAAYQIPVPLRWLADGFPHVYRDLPYSGFPSSTGFIFWALLGVGKLQAPRLFMLCVHAMVFASLFLLLRRWAANWVAGVLCLCFALSPAYLIFSGEVFVEPFILLDALAIMMLAMGARQRGLAWILGLSILASGAASVKLTGVLVAAAGCMIMVAQLRRGARLRAFALFCLFSALLTAPFYLRPLLETGNPFYPFFESLSGGSPGAVAMSALHHSEATRFGIHGFWSLLSSPVIMLLDSACFDGSWGVQAFLLLPFLGLLFAMALSGGIRAPRWALLLLACALSLYLAWHFSAQQARFLMPAVAALYLCLASFWRSIPKELGVIFAVLLALSALFGLRFDEFERCGDQWSAFLRGQDPVKLMLQASKGQMLPQAYAALMERTPEGAKTMLLFERRILLCPHRCLIGTPLYQDMFFAPPPQGDPGKACDSIMETFKKGGFEFLLSSFTLQNQEALPENMERTKVFRAALANLLAEGRLEKVWDCKGYILCKIHY